MAQETRLSVDTQRDLIIEDIVADVVCAKLDNKEGLGTQIERVLGIALDYSITDELARWNEEQSRSVSDEYGKIHVAMADGWRSVATEKMRDFATLALVDPQIRRRGERYFRDLVLIRKLGFSAESVKALILPQIEAKIRQIEDAK